MSAIEDKLGWLAIAEKSLKHVLDTPEEDEAWAHIQDLNRASKSERNI